MATEKDTNKKFNNKEIIHDFGIDEANIENKAIESRIRELSIAGAGTRSIIKLGDNVLRAKTRVVNYFGHRLWTLLDDMKLTTLKSDGVGLAAPQIAILKKIVVIMFRGEEFELINPVISNEIGESIAPEGCLSVPSSMNCYVKRPYKLTLSYQDRYGKRHEGEFDNYLARIICHEVDHLNGILFIDRKCPPPEEESRKDPV
ncbi:MAG: peptide deformylase [Christensenellaceae bacterium]|jgi:peptide deformylase|nr:peptide deformylase [Christensenellaceae bacterium]